MAPVKVHLQALLSKARKAFGPFPESSVFSIHRVFVGARKIDVEKFKLKIESHHDGFFLDERKSEFVR